MLSLGNYGFSGSLFIVCWVFPCCVNDILLGWHGSFVWKLVRYGGWLLELFWCMWKERDEGFQRLRAFKVRVEKLVLQIIMTLI